MIKTSTNYDIVKYIYNELEEKKIGSAPKPSIGSE